MSDVAAPAPVAAPAAAAPVDQSLRANFGENPTNVSNGLSDETRTAEAFEHLIKGGLFEDNKQQTRAEATEKQPTPAQRAAVEQPAAADDTQTTQQQPADEVQQAVSFDDFVTRAGLTRDQLLSAPIKVKLDGKDVDVKLTDVLRDYGLYTHNSAKANELTEQRREFEAERTMAQEKLGGHFKTAALLAQLAQGELNREYANVKWDELRQQDPGQFAAMALTFNQRQQQINQALQQMVAAQNEQNAVNLKAEQQKILAAVPEWQDQAKFQADSKLLAAFATSKGFSPAELSGLVDSRQLLVLRDAMRARDLQAEVDTLKAQLAGKVDAALKQVRAAPAMASPGARTERDPKVVAYQGAKQRLRENPRDQDVQAEAFEQWARRAGV